jgi:hypothetical protein
VLTPYLCYLCALLNIAYILPYLPVVYIPRYLDAYFCLPSQACFSTELGRRAGEHIIDVLTYTHTYWTKTRSGFGFSSFNLFSSFLPLLPGRLHRCCIQVWRYVLCILICFHLCLIRCRVRNYLACSLPRTYKCVCLRPTATTSILASTRSSLRGWHGGDDDDTSDHPFPPSKKEKKRKEKKRKEKISARHGRRALNARSRVLCSAPAGHCCRERMLEGEFCPSVSPLRDHITETKRMVTGGFAHRISGLVRSDRR